MNKFTVTTGNKDTAELNRLTRTIKLHDIWNRQYHNTVASMFEKYKSLDDWSQDELMKVALCGVNYIKYVADIERENQRLDASYNTPFVCKENGFNIPVYQEILDKISEVANAGKMDEVAKMIPKAKYDTPKPKEVTQNNQTINVTQDINVNCPNVTNTTGAEYLVKALRKASADVLVYNK